MYISTANNCGFKRKAFLMSNNQVNASQVSPSIKPDDKSKPEEKDEKTVSAPGQDKKNLESDKK